MKIKRVLALVLALAIASVGLTACLDEPMLDDETHSDSVAVSGDLDYYASSVTVTTTTKTTTKATTTTTTTTTSTSKITTTTTTTTKTTATTERTNRETSTTTKKTTKKTTISTRGQQASADLVWIPTNGGKKYHCRSGCSGMKNPIQVTKSEAINQGFGACGRCY